MRKTILTGIGVLLLGSSMAFAAPQSFRSDFRNQTPSYQYQAQQQVQGDSWQDNQWQGNRRDQARQVRERYSRDRHQRAFERSRREQERHRRDHRRDRRDDD